jgi:hypothetical protein
MGLQRLRRIVGQPINPACVIVRATADETHDPRPPARYDAVLAQMEERCLSLSPLGGEDIREMASLLGTDTVQDLGRFFDRDPRTNAWYYQVYGEGEGNTNHTLAFMGTRGRPCPRGDVLLVKNGPIGGEWETDRAITAETVAKTVWWYWASGRDMYEVTQERDMARVLLDYL